MQISTTRANKPVTQRIGLCKEYTIKILVIIRKHTMYKPNRRRGGTTPLVPRTLPVPVFLLWMGDNIPVVDCTQPELRRRFRW